MNQTYIEDGLEYSVSNHRMKYNPEYHENHGKPFTTQELIYMCSMWSGTKKSNIALALGRTHGTVLSKVYLLKKNGQFEHFRKLGER
jgi:hypothetical protein